MPESEITHTIISKSTGAGRSIVHRPGKVTYEEYLKEHYPRLFEEFGHTAFTAIQMVQPCFSLQWLKANGDVVDVPYPKNEKEAA